MRPVACRLGLAASLLALVAALLVALAPATAQMVLPGANNGNAVDAPPKASGSTGGSTPAPAKPVFIKPPAIETIVGHALSRDGKSGGMTFEASDGKLSLTRLKLDGDKLSRPQDTCKVDVALDAPIVATPAGRPSGTLRYDVPLAACPFTIDILDGAVLVSRAEPSCAFKAADCRVTPGGLWGPAAAEITPTRAKDLERQRVHIETTMRTNFRALLKKAGKDRGAVKAIARDQAAFSSQREMMCRDYDQEPVHGFCSTQITEARALELLAKFGPAEERSAADARRIPRPKPKPAVVAPPAAAPAPSPAADPPQ